MESSSIDDVIASRRALHAKPELGFDVHETAAFVAEKLTEFGCDEVVTGIGRTGVVGVIHGKEHSERAIGLRADMDALPIEEVTGATWSSKTPGKMHACGHDGHTAMLLGATRELARTRDFCGRAVVVFQPAEEGLGGGKAMVDDGLMARFGIEEIYAMHTEPGLPIGRFATTSGPIGASVDGFRITIEGKGGHAASPHECIDPLVIGAHIIMALQTIVSRNVDPMSAAVVSTTALHSGAGGSVISPTAELVGNTRAFDPMVCDLIQGRLTMIAEQIAIAYGATAKVAYRRIYPPTINHVDQTAFAVQVARAIVGHHNVDANLTPLMGSEDFAFMLEERPGNIMLIGNGDSAPVHDPRYDFDDAAIPHGIRYFKALIEMGMPLNDRPANAMQGE